IRAEGGQPLALARTEKICSITCDLRRARLAKVCRLSYRQQTEAQDKILSRRCGLTRICSTRFSAGRTLFARSREPDERCHLPAVAGTGWGADCIAGGETSAVLRVEERRGRPALLSKAAIEKTAPDVRYDIAPSVPLIARDSFVAETASNIEQLQATVRLMSRDHGQLASKVGELQEAAAQDQRWYTYQQSEKRSKQTQLEELLRGCRDLKARLDQIEQRSRGT